MIQEIQRIVDITGSRRSTVYRDLEALVDSDMIDDVYIDYNADRVVSKKFVPATSHKTVVKCAECGSNNELIVGVTKACAFCRQPLLLGRS